MSRINNWSAIEIWFLYRTICPLNPERSVTSKGRGRGRGEGDSVAHFAVRESADTYCTIRERAYFTKT